MKYWVYSIVCGGNLLLIGTVPAGLPVVQKFRSFIRVSARVAAATVEILFFSP